MLGHAKTLTDEQLVAFRNAAFASAPIIMDIGVAMMLVAVFAGSWPLFFVGIAMIFIGIFGPIGAAFLPVSILERRQRGRWHRDDTMSMIQAMSWTFPVGFAVAISLLALIPVNRRLPDAGWLARTLILAAITGIALWGMFRLVMYQLRKSNYEMMKKYALTVEEVMIAAEDVIGSIKGSVVKITRNPLSGNIIWAEFLTTSGLFRIRRMTPRNTMVEIRKSRDWQIIAGLLDSAVARIHPKK